MRRSNAPARRATPPDRFLFVVAGGGPDPFAVFVRHRGAVVFVGIQPMEDKYKDVFCKVTSCAHAGPRRFTVPEEKRTDVNIAIHMIDDAYQNSCDKFVLVSGDSDLVPGVNRLKIRFPGKQVIVYVPSRNGARGAAIELRSSADKNKIFSLNLLKGSQFPATIPGGMGGVIVKPSGW